MKRSALGMIAIVLLASTAPAALAAEQGSSGYTGSTVAFETTSNALVDYSVDGTTVAESIRVQSRSDTESSLSLGASADLGAVVNLTGATLSIDAEGETSTTIESDSGATLSAHDDDRGTLVVATGDRPQYVEFGLSGNASAVAESDDRVVVTTDDGTEGAVVVVGDGAVTVNEAGNVSADVGSEGRLVFRSYTDGRSEADEHVETLIADGTAAASVSVDGEGETVVAYDDETTVEVTERGDGEVTLDVTRTSHDGKVVVTSVAESTVEPTEDVQVQVDGEAAVRASSYAELREATDGGDRSKFLAERSAAAGASADVLVGVNHFSTREVTVTGGDGNADGTPGEGTGDADGTTGEGTGDADGTTGEGTGDGADAGTTSGDGPGFGAVAALLALGVSVAVLARRPR